MESKCFQGLLCVSCYSNSTFSLAVVFYMAAHVLPVSAVAVAEDAAGKEKAAAQHVQGG